VSHNHDPIARLSADSVRQRGPQLINAPPPVVIVENGRESSGAQIQLQPQIRIQHHAQWNNFRAVLQMQRRQSADLNINRIQPQNVVWQRRLALDAELRAHDAGYDKHANRIRSEGLRSGSLCELAQLHVLELAEISSQFPLVLAADEQVLHLSVTPRELVVRSDVIRQGMLLNQVADLIPQSAGGQSLLLRPSRHRTTG